MITAEVHRKLQQTKLKEPYTREAEEEAASWHLPPQLQRLQEKR